MDITMEPVGVVHSSITEPGQIPCGNTGDIRAVVEVHDRYVEGMADIAPGDKLMVLFYFHRAPEARLTVPLKGVGPMVGVFSSHSPTRPNFIGVTKVLVESVEGSCIHVKGADMIDGTPVLDMKPV